MTRKQTRRRKSNAKSKKKRRTYKRSDYKAPDGMLTTVWGPAMWHSLHTMSFNYPVKPTHKDKINYRRFILNLQNVLPCRYCRENLKRNFKHPLKMCDMKNRDSFSRYIYKLHEVVNKMLGKNQDYHIVMFEKDMNTSELDAPKKNQRCLILNKEKAQRLYEPLYGKKAKCVIKIVPQEEKCKTLVIDEDTIKRR